MDEFIKLLDPSLDYINHEMIGDTIVIRVASNKEKTVFLLWSSFFATLVAKKYLLVREPILPPFMLQFSSGKEYGIRYSCEGEHDYMSRRQIFCCLVK